MKILKQGIIDTSECTCERCQAKLEYTTKDIIGSGKIINTGGSDWLDAPIIQKEWPTLVKKAIKKYKDMYVATGYFAKREGYIECPCCGNHITFDEFPVQVAVLPSEATNEEGEIVYDEVINIPNTAVSLLKKHYEEFTRK